MTLGTEAHRGPEYGRQAARLQRLASWELALFGLSFGSHNESAGSPSVNLTEAPF